MSFVKFCSDLDVNKKLLLDEIEKSKKDIELLLKIKDKNYENFIKPFYKSSDRVHQPMSMISNLDSCLNSEKTQEVYSFVLPFIDEYGIDLETNEDIYNAFLFIRENDHTINSIQKRVLDEEIKNFKNSGVNLEQSKKDELKQISIKLSQLSKDFSQNLIDANNNYELILDNYEDVKELPKIDLEQSKITKDGKECYRFTLKMPSYLAYMTYGSSSKYREELYKAFVTRAPQNEGLIDEILSLREKKSKLLNFDNFAQMSISDKDAPSVEVVQEFLEKIAIKAQSGARQELKELENFAGTNINSYDMGYFSEKMKKKFHDIDEEEYMCYFEINNVIDYALKFIEDSFKVVIKEVKDASIWDEKVKVYDFFDKNNLFGRLYLDLENRDNKKGGAWMHNFETHHVDENGQEQLSSAFVVCNFMASSSANPSLLKHSDIVTLFHELGHAIHHIFSQVPEISLSGVNGIAWDVVEFPSQFLEQFAYDKKVLQAMGTHFETLENLSDKMIDKLIDSKNFQASLGMVRQCEFAIFDILLHKKLYSGSEVQELLNSIRQKYSPLLPPSYNKFQNGFSHIFSGGYASGYYSYKWAEVLSADLYIQNTKKNILKEYKEHVLLKGASENMGILFENITSSKPNINALFELYNIKD